VKMSSNETYRSLVKIIKALVVGDYTTYKHNEKICSKTYNRILHVV
jgi:hypothetical protein